MNFKYYTPKEAEAMLCPKGRITLDENGLLTDWSASGVSLRFIGSGFSVSFAAYNCDAPAYFLAELDGVRSKFAVTNGSEKLILEAEQKEHTLTLLRLSEGAVPVIMTQFCVTSEYNNEARLLEAPLPKSRRIVFFGDSITCGYGNLGDPSKCFYTGEEDVTRAYAYKAAQMLSAEAEIVSISGQGIVRNCAGEVGLPISEFFRWQSRSLKTPCKFENQPNLVVINAGTNDYSGKVSEDEFYERSISFLKELRSVYPNAEIVWFYGLMTSPYDRVFKKIEADITPVIGHFHYLCTTPIYENECEVGGVGHPSVEGARRGAEELALYINKMGLLK